MNRRLLAVLAAMGVMSGCVTAPPPGPNVRVMPAPGKPFEVFAQDDAVCRQYAAERAGYVSPQQTTDQAVAGAAAGAALGATAGALLGPPHNRGEGAAVGAGMGVLAGSAAGTQSAYRTSEIVQRRYDIAYEQCMYAKGNQVQGFSVEPARTVTVPVPATYATPPASYPPPPPPASYPPPPPWR